MSGSRRRWRIASIVLGCAIVLLAAGALSQRELRDTLLHSVAPAYARDANFVHLKKDSVDLYLLGTIHGRHLTTEEYKLARLEAALTNLKPDLVMVEMRPEELARGRWGDGPIEMPFVALTAKSRGTAVEGIDWWEITGPTLRRNDDNRDDRIVANLLAKLPAKGTVVVFIGYSHVPEQQRRLVARGFEERELTTPEKARLLAPSSAPFRFPAGMAAAIKARIEDAEGIAAKGLGTESELNRSVAQSRRAYLKLIEETGEGVPQ